MFTRLFFVLPALLLAFGLARAEDRSIVVLHPWDRAALSAPSTNYAAAIDLNTVKPESFTFSLQLQATNLTVTNAGDVTVSYELSNNNVDYLTNQVIVAGLSFTNSPEGGGKGFYTITPGISRYIRLRAEVTGTNALWLSGWLAVQ